jgi:hypothetical protein
MTCCFLLPRDLSVHYPPIPPFLRLSEDLTYGPTLHPMCIYHPCLFVYVYITTVKSAVIMEKSPTDEIPFPPKKLLFFWLYFLFSLLFLSFVQTRLTPGAPTHFRSVGFQGKRKNKVLFFVVCVESSVTLWKSRSLTLLFFFLASFAWNTILYLFCSFLAMLFFFLTRGINASEIDTNFFFCSFLFFIYLLPSPLLCILTSVIDRYQT